MSFTVMLLNHRLKRVRGLLLNEQFPFALLFIGTVSVLIFLELEPERQHYFLVYFECLFVIISISFLTMLALALQFWRCGKKLKIRQAHSSIDTPIDNVGTWDWDIRHDILKWDDATYRIFGIDKDNFNSTYHAWLSIVAPEDRSEAYTRIKNLVNGESAYFMGDSPYFTYVCKIVNLNKQFKHIKVDGIVLYDLNGRATRIVGTNIDVTEIVEGKNQQIRKIEEASQAKTEFLANISHEIKTPLSSITGYSEMLLNGDLNEVEATNAITSVYHTSQHALNIVNQVLDISKLESGKIEVDLTRGDLFDLTRDVTELLCGKTSKDGVTFSLDYLYPIPRFFISDHTKLRQILLNLADNARKFTEKGEIKVVVSFDAVSNVFSFSVIDSGVGMSSEQLRRLFKAFSQGDALTSQRYGGFGLGLSLSKKFASILGGDIHVESTLGQGSKFTLILPTQAVHHEDMLRDEATAVQKITPSQQTIKLLPKFTAKILLAEDGEENQKFLSLLLNKMGMEVKVAKDGEQAVELALSFPYDLIVMDMYMPNLDGIEAVSLMRKINIKTPILGLSADTRKERIDLYINAGCNDFLCKPFSRSQLIEKLRTFLPNHSQINEIASDDLLKEDLEGSMLEFIASFSERIDELESLLKSDSYVILGRVAHRLAGAAAFAYPQTQELLEMISHESLGRNALQLHRLLNALKELHSKKPAFISHSL